MKNAAVKVASPAHACGIHVYVCSTGKFEFYSVAKTKRRVSVRYGCSDSSKLNMPLEHLFTRQCTANFD